jgi:single-stranded DNA-binding protein
MNFVSLIGTIENHPTEVETNKGQKHARFRLITSNTIVTAQGTPKTRRETHDVFAWGKWHQVIRTYGQPNLHVAIEGRLVNRYSRWKGRIIKITEIEINDLVII